MMNINWTCGYCNQPTTITSPNYSDVSSNITTSQSELERVLIRHVSIACPNPNCKKLTLVVELCRSSFTDVGWLSYGPKIDGVIKTWNLLPHSRAKPQPAYIPEQIRQDYLEACLISDDSPKASAALSRRCLQGIVRDFWEIQKNERGNLGAELNSIKDRLDEDTWEAIKTIRSVGDIGAHMEKDVNVIIDIEPSEAGLLIELIETLLEDWYVARNKRQERNARTKALGEKKLEERRAAKKASSKTTI